MPDREPALRCYRCGTPAAPDEEACRACDFPLDWGAISDLRGMDYLRSRLLQWKREGAISPPALADRLVAEVERNRETLLSVLLRDEAPAVEPQPAAPQPAAPQAVPGDTAEAPALARAVSGEAAVEPGPTPAEPAEPPERRDELPFPPPAAERPARRPLLDVLVDLGTVRLMLYTGALMLAVGTTIWLRDALRIQLQRPVVQASLLGIGTFAALAGGVALVMRARDRAEQRLIGRGVLFLGSLLLPLNPWFWLRTGLIEDRGNGWVVGLVSFALSLSIALGLGDRVFVYLSYAAALLTGWLLTFKLTGGASPGAYALVLALISGAFVHAERPVARAGREGWEKLGGAFFLCGHVGVALTLLFYTNAVRLLPPELFAAFRHFDASGYTPWVGVAVSLLAAQTYLYSAWRREDARYTYLGTGVALWCAALSLLAWDSPAGAWLFACGAAALAARGLGSALAGRPLWGPPLRASSRALAWAGLAASAVAFTGFALAGVELRWFTAAGAALLLAVFALDALARDRVGEAVPVPLLGLFLAAWLLRRAGLAWAHADAVLALLAAAAPFAGARLLAARDGARTGARYATTLATYLLAASGVALSLGAVAGDDYFRPVPLAAAVAIALGAHAWHALTREVRYPAYGAAVLFLQLAVALAAFGLELRNGIEDRYRPFLLAPFPYALLGAWLALRRAPGERVRELERVARAGAAVGVFVAALAAAPLLLDTAFSTPASFLFALAMALLAAVPLAVAAVGRDGDLAAAEGAFGCALALAGYFGFAAAVAGRVEGREGLLFLGLAGGAPPLLHAARLALRGRAPAVSRPAGAFGTVLAGLLTLGLAGALATYFAGPLEGALDTRLGLILMAGLLVAHALWRAASEEALWRRAVWTADGAFAALVALHGALLLAGEPARGAALAAIAGAALLLAAGARWRRRGSPLAPSMLAIGHVWVAVAVAHATRWEARGVPVSWPFAGLCLAATAAYAGAAAAAARGSMLDRAHRAVLSAAAFATASVALHAAGRTTAALQAEPLALLLVAAMAAAIWSGSEWARTEAAVLAHAAMGGLLVVALATGLDASDSAWTAVRLARFAALVSAFYLVASTRRDPASVGAAITAASVSAIAFCHHLGVAWPTRVIVVAVFGAALVHAATRMSVGLQWAAPAVALGGHANYLLALAAELLLVVPALGLSRPELGRHAAAFAVLAACAWATHRALGEAGAPYLVAWRALALATYCLVGLRLGYHPWRDSAYYTLPVGALLVGLGIYASRQGDERRDAAALLWLGSLLAAAPMLLHALDNRFVRDVSPVGYDAATLSVGLALAIAGVLFQLRAPALVGAVAFGADLFVVAFSQVRWEEIPLSIYLATVGALLFGASWLLLYRREDLMRLRDFLSARHEAFQQWR